MTIIPIENEAHWHEIRKRHIGGSEIPALFYLRPFHTTYLELWLIKRGEASGTIEDNDRMFWGRMVEDSIAKGVAEKYAFVIEKPLGYYKCDDTPGMGCTPDRIIFSDEQDGPGLLQIKNVDRLEYLKWQDGEPPLKFQLQLQHELACANYKWGALAILVGGNELHLIQYPAHLAVIAKIKTAIKEFWHSVAMGVQPKATGDDYEILKEYYKGMGDVIDMRNDNQLPVLCAQAKEAGERKKAAESDEKQAKADILQKIGNASVVDCAGFRLKRTQVNKKSYVVKDQSYIMLTIKPEKE